MHLPLVSTAFDYLIRKIELDLSRVVELGEDIRRNRNVGSHHTQLDALEDALADGPRSVAREYRTVTDIKGIDFDGGDGKLVYNSC